MVDLVVRRPCADGHIAANAKAKASSGEASPEEYRVAEGLKELTTRIVTTVDNAKKRIADMPHAKKKLNPLWGLLTEPLFQIIAAVGLLLSGVLGLVGKLLNGLGLGGLVNGILGGLGVDKLLGGLGLGSTTRSWIPGRRRSAAARSSAEVYSHPPRTLRQPKHIREQWVSKRSSQLHFFDCAHRHPRGWL